MKSITQEDMKKEKEIISEAAQGESQVREFKRQVDNPESVAGEIVAFANSGGGTIYFGIDDHGDIVGLAEPNLDFQTLTNICRDRCIPPVSPIIEQHKIKDHKIILLTISPELNRAKPYRTAGGRFFIRTGRDKIDAAIRAGRRRAPSAYLGAESIEIQRTA